MWTSWWSIPLSVAAGVLMLWLVLLCTLWFARPDETGLRDALRLLPDILRLLTRLAADPQLPRRVRVQLVLLLAYLALPIDVVPDFIPILGYADDAIIAALVLRSVTRTVGAEILARHWPGTPDGLAALCRLCRLP